MLSNPMNKGLKQVMQSEASNSSRKRILITGASGGIGSAIAKAFANQNAIILLHYYKNENGITKLLDDVKSTASKAQAYSADLSTSQGRESLATKVIRDHGGCDILINNAGSPIITKEFSHYTDEEVTKIIGLNFISSFTLCQQMFPIMKSNNYGRIVNISSIGVKFGGSPHALLYSAAKAALETLTLNLAKQGAEYNVLVNAIRPGVIDTALHEKYPKDLLSRQQLIPVKRLGSPEDIASMAVYLANDTSSFITGQVISVSGGE